MGYSLYVYRAPPGAGTPNTWEADHFVPLGTFAEVRAEVERLVPGLAWAACEEPPGWAAMSGPQPWFLAFRKPGTQDVVQCLVVTSAERAVVRALVEGTDRRLFHAESCRDVPPGWVRA
jgi:hypothetical protein